MQKPARHITNNSHVKDAEKSGAPGTPSVSQNRDAATPDASRRGVFITFEGGEGVGKSTHILLLALRLEEAGVEVLRLREPGGTRIGEAVRAILLDPAHSELDDMSELLLYEAARAQLVGQVIEPALARGVTVLCDRFTDSTLAYQGTARGLNRELVEHANQLGSKGLVPQRTIVLIHDLHDALNRATQQGADRLEAEGLAFHRRVHEGFLELAEREPARVRLVQSRRSKRDTAEAIFAAVADLFPQVAQREFAITDELVARVKRERDR
jgi:dTMP kinase